MSKISMKAVAAATVIGGVIAGAVSASAALNLPTQNCSYMFNTNMKLGSRGTDVMNLQKVLNAYPQTRIAESGAGSPGMETTYFGAATRAAVNKFQALHLVELGITAPTANVFAGTRGLLNAICVGNNNGGNTGNNGGNTGNNGGTNTTGPVSAFLSASQPAGTAVAGQAAANLANITFTGNGTVTAVELQRIGVSSDSVLSNVYLYDGNTRLTDAASVITGGYIRFNNPNGLFSVNGSRTISVRSDIDLNATAGQTVGVKLNSVTANGSASTFSNVMGNYLTIASVSGITTANVASTTPISRSVDAGTTNLSVFSRNLDIGQRAANLRAATFRYVGSAPVDSVANLSLYVDSVKVAGPAMVNAANDNKVTFDLGATPYLLQTGTHTVELRGDIVKGSSRNFVFSIENAADLLIEDTQLSGVFVTPKVNNTTFTRIQGDTFNVNSGTLTVTTDTTFNTTTITGGSSNVTIGQYTMKAYGEDVKVNSLSVLPSLTGTSPAFNGIANVSLYVNGGQVGSSQNFTGVSSSTPLTFNLGSSLIVPAGQTVTLTVKADMKSVTGVSYTAGTATTSLVLGSSNAQGQSSFTVVNTPAAVGQTLTIASGAATFGRTSGFVAQTVSPNTSNVKVGSFTIQSGSSESITLTGATVSASTTGNLNNINNLVLKNGSTVLASPTGIVNSTNSFSFNSIVVPANSSYTIDVYADIANATNTSAYEFGMTLNYRGNVSGTTNSGTIAPTGTGAIVTIGTAALAAPTVSVSSPVAQAVVGGSTFGVATYTLKTQTSGTTATVREMRFQVTGSNDAVQTITVGGQTFNVVNGFATSTGLAIPVNFAGTDVPVTVKYSGFQNTTTGGTLTSGVASTSVVLTYVEAVSGNGAVTNVTSAVPSNGMTLVASKPTVTVAAGNVNTLILGAESKVGEFTVTADANGKISVATATMALNVVGASTTSFGTFRVADQNTTITGSSVGVAASGNSATLTIGFTPNYEIVAGQSKTFSVYGTVNGNVTGSTAAYVASSLSASGFLWRDVLGGNTLYSGTTTPSFPTNSFTTQR